AAAGLAASCALAVAMQVMLFGISVWLALLAVPLALVLAAVAARVVGETGIPPIGAIGKVSQLGIGLAAPGQAVTNLMAANVAGGAAGQCADLMNDYKVGHAIGASPLRQSVAQVCGVLVGAVVGSVVYLTLIPDPAAMLLTAEWPAPAVATWKAVAEALAEGFTAVPPGARIGMAAGAIAGVALGLLETRWRHAPSAVAFGLAFVIPASICFTMALGALAAWLFERRFPSHAARFTVAAAAGLVVGESLVGVAASFAGMTGG
ncbi:MAG: OPT/YSL family transporter, partial [Phycisphaeraceae bacterium]